MANHLNKILNNVLQLPNAFNVQNTSTQFHSLKIIKINEDTRLCSFDVEIFTTILIHEDQNVVKSIIGKNNNISQGMKVEIINVVSTISEQNYVEHNGK
jgi:hypothetical protein